ncbi:uncharacterized protein LOC124937468 [Impatiens glandulifera]|uniref:uncharacterized protein LOC124937468 n=1 Tax=Impatiens glandulifera TaxID=253017 RepID=UPI001FB06955|nr:uncharacterized protein LOC124937468 [Impatiens glandulifera]
MEKRLRSSLHNSADEFISSAAKLGLKSVKPSLKTLVHRITPSSELSSSLPLAINNAISRSLSLYKQSFHPTNADLEFSPISPPTKRVRKSSRHVKSGDDSTGNKGDGMDSLRDNAVQKLQTYSYLVYLCVSHPKKAFPESDLLPGIRELHDNLVLFESESVLQLEIANLCEEWWKSEIQGREVLISQLLPYLLSRSLTLKKKVDVHRVYVLREAFALFDFEDDSIEDLKLLLMRCLISPLYLKTDDGRKFIAFMFGLSFRMLKEALAMIQSQIPFGRKSMLEAYADILFRAWKVMKGELLEEIESGFLQKLIDGAIHGSSSSFAASVRRVLGGFINQRTVEGVEKLLYRLAEPVIFRSLQVANSDVRKNALHLLLDLFPLEDPDSTKDVKDILLDRQFFLLERLVMDECPEVRVVAVEGCCRILSLFWEVIPSSTITKILKKLFDDISHDTCVEVRSSTLNGIIYLMGNPQSHEILKALLPRFKHMILDSSTSIRSTLLDLLLLISDIRTFQFHKVVPLEMLLSTLANDQPVIADKITKLLIPSYFPSKTNPKEACSRCITLIKRSPAAGARFCEFALSGGASFGSLIELAKELINMILSPHQLDAAQIDGILLATAHICKNVVNEGSCITTLKKLLSPERLRRLFAASSSRHAQSSLCDIISYISPNDVGDLLKTCMALITNGCDLHENLDWQVEVRSAHKVMFSCNGFDDMLETITRLLQNAANEDIEFTAKRRRVRSSGKISAKIKHNSKRSSISTFKENYLKAVGISWQIKDLLVCDDTRKAILGSRILDTTLFALKDISEMSILRCMGFDYMHSYPVLAYTSLALHISLQSDAINEENSCTSSKKKSRFHFPGSSSEEPFLEQMVNHLMSCTSNLLVQQLSHNGEKVGEDHEDVGGPVNKQQRIVNTVKILTAVLKFIVDATALNLISNNSERCLTFTIQYLEFIISNLSKHSSELLLSNEEDQKESVLCLKSSCTYAAKFLNLLAKSAKPSLPSTTINTLANHIFDLILTVELSLGSKNTTHILTAIKPWLPDMTLGLGSTSSDSNSGNSQIPSWVSFITKIELSELSEEEISSGWEKVPVFKKLIELAMKLLKGQMDIVDLVGMSLLKYVGIGLERKEFEFVLGLVRFICLKLVGNDEKLWKDDDLKLMPSYLMYIYKEIKREALDPSNDDDSRGLLQSAVELLEPACLNYNAGDGEWS